MRFLSEWGSLRADGRRICLWDVGGRSLHTEGTGGSKSLYLRNRKMRMVIRVWDPRPGRVRVLSYRVLTGRCKDFRFCSWVWGTPWNPLWGVTIPYFICLFIFQFSCLFCVEKSEVTKEFFFFSAFLDRDLLVAFAGPVLARQPRLTLNLGSLPAAVSWVLGCRHTLLKDARFERRHFLLVVSPGP